MYRGLLQDFFWKKVTDENRDVACLYFNVEIIKTGQYLTNILQCETLIDDMKENIYHSLDTFKKFHK